MAEDKRYDRLLKAFGELQTAALAVLVEADSIFENNDGPTKYRAPYGSINELRTIVYKHFGLREPPQCSCEPARQYCGLPSCINAHMVKPAGIK